MAFFDDVKRSLKSTGKQVAKKTKELTDIVQLKSQLSAVKEAVEEEYTSIGRQVFEEALEADETRFAAEFEVIRKSLEKKAKLEEEISALEGSLYCPECGAKIEKTAVFCSHCGVKLEKPETEEEEGAEEAEETEKAPEEASEPAEE